MTGIAFSVPSGALGFWKKRLELFHVELSGQKESRDVARIGFHDPDGLGLELVDSGDEPSEAAWPRRLPLDLPFEASFPPP